MNTNEMIELALNEGFCAAEVIPMSKVVFDSSFRPYCEENYCGRYGANHSCPPACGTPEEMEAKLKPYKNALVFQSIWDISDYCDEQAINEAKQFHNKGMLRVIKRLREDGHNGIMAGASSCTLCERCASLDNEPCRDPERCFSCLSAYCIFVKKLADECGMEYVSDGLLGFFGLYAF